MKTDHENTSKFIHNINSDISALLQAIELISDNWNDNPELMNKMVPLTLEKIVCLNKNWEKFKSITR